MRTDIDLELVARCERAAVAGWPATVEQPAPGGWLLRATPGLDRGRSNHALSPCRALAESEIAPAVHRVRDFADRHGIRPGIQVSPAHLHGRLTQALDDEGWSRQWPVLVLTAGITAGISDGRDLDPASGSPPRITATDHAELAWLQAWERCEPGRDVAAHADTVFELLAGRACFARIGHDAVGIAVPAEGTVGMFCLAVDAGHRRQGLGTAIVRGLLQRAGLEADTAYLQVEETNAAARALYGALGFGEAYRYEHRVQASAAGSG